MNNIRVNTASSLNNGTNALNKKTKKLLSNIIPIYEVEANTQKSLFHRLDEDLNRVNDQINKNKKLAQSPYQDIKNDEHSQGIINFKRKMGLLHQDTQEKFKENMRIFNTVDTFIDIREKLEKVSQLDKIQQFLRQKTLLEERRKQKNFNLFSKKEYAELDHFEELKENNNNSDKLVLVDDKEANIYKTDLLAKTNGFLEERKNKKNQINNPNKSKLEKAKSNSQVINEEYSMVKSNDKFELGIKSILNKKGSLDMKLDNLESEQLDQNFTNDGLAENNSKNLQNMQKQIYEYLKQDKYKFPLVSDEENPFDFYEKIESGEVFQDKSPSKIMKNTDQSRYINFDCLEKETKIINPFDTNMIFQDTQYVLINNLENFHLNSQKLVNETKYQSRIIYKHGKKALTEMNLYTPNETINGKNFVSTATTTTEDFMKNKKSNGCSENEHTDSDHVFIIDRKFSDIFPVQVINGPASKTMNSPKSGSQAKSNLKNPTENSSKPQGHYTRFSVDLFQETGPNSEHILQKDQNIRDFYSRKISCNVESKMGCRSPLNLDTNYEENSTKKTDYNDNTQNTQSHLIKTQSNETKSFLSSLHHRFRKSTNNLYTNKLIENKMLYKFKSTNNHNLNKIISPTGVINSLPYLDSKQGNNRNALTNPNSPSRKGNKNNRKNIFLEETNNFNRLIQDLEVVTRQSQVEKNELKKSKVVLSESFEKSKQRANRLKSDVFDVKASDAISNSKQNLIKLQKIITNSVNKDDYKLITN